MAVAGLVVVVTAVFVIAGLSYLGSGKTILPSNSGEDINNSKRIITYAANYDSNNNKITYTLSYAKMQDITSNSGIRFLNPFGKAMARFSHETANSNPNEVMKEEEKVAFVKDADVFEQYILIRLPPELGGDARNVTAFRAYSDLDPESKCMLVYRHDNEVGPVLEDPCHSDIFRVSDGYSCFGRIALGSNPALSGYNAIPRMRLAVDDQGYLFAIKPDGLPSGDGTVGEGRIIPIDEIRVYDSDLSCDIKQSQ